MAGETILKIGNVAMPYGLFRWPKYRGCVARPFDIDCPGEFYGPLSALATADKTRETVTLSVTGPAGPGMGAGEDTVNFNGVYIERVLQVTDQLCKVVLCDKRLVLSRRVADMDFRIKFGDGYLEGTDYPTYQAALQALVASIDVLRNNTAPNAYQYFPQVDCPDGVYLSGNTLIAALQDLLDRAGAALTVFNDGLFHFVANDDLDNSSVLPAKTAYSWFIEPGWLTNKATITGRPRKFYAYYPERCCLRLEGSDPGSSVAHRTADELAVELEQVYLSKGKYWTLEELLVEWGYNANALSDRDICECFFTDTLQGTSLENTAGTTEFIGVFNAIQDGWRRLWRIKYPKLKGHIGGWTNWAFGKINIDGSVQAVSVECKWVSRATSIDVPLGGQFIGTELSKNHEAVTGTNETAPLTASWEGGDPALGIIRLSSTQKEGLQVVMPGALVDPIKVERVAALDDGNGGAIPLTDYDIIESEEWTKARFVKSFDIAIYLCATKRMPNNETRWLREEIAGYSDGDIDYVELPTSGELFSIRDYAHPTEQNHSAQADGLGPYFFVSRLQTSGDAQARADSWKALHACPFDSYGIAESVALARNVECIGPIREVAIEMDGEVVRSRVDVGNLADPEARLRRATKRLADRSFQTAGVPQI